MFRGTVGLGGALVAATVLVAVSAQAQDDLGPPAKPAPQVAPFAIDGGAHAMMFFGRRCTTKSDTAMCPDTTLAAGFHIAPAFYLTPHWSIGVRGAVTFQGTRTDGLLTFWQVEAEGRYHFTNEARTDPWIGADAGLLILTDHVENDGLGPPATFTSTSPIFGLGTGISFPVGTAFRLGPELRGIFLPRDGSALASGSRGTTLSDQTGVMLAVTGTGLLGT